MAVVSQVTGGGGGGGRRGGGDERGNGVETIGNGQIYQIFARPVPRQPRDGPRWQGTLCEACHFSLKRSRVMRVLGVSVSGSTPRVATKTKLPTSLG